MKTAHAAQPDTSGTWHVPVDEDGRNIISDSELIEIMLRSSDGTEFRKLIVAASERRLEAVAAARAAHPAFDR